MILVSRLEAFGPDEDSGPDWSDELWHPKLKYNQPDSNVYLPFSSLQVKLKTQTLTIIHTDSQFLFSYREVIRGYPELRVQP